MTVPAGIEWGCVPRYHGRFARAYGDGDLPTYVDRDITLLPRSRWQDDVGIDDSYVEHVFSQMDGMCTSNGLSQAMSLCRSACQALPYRRFAPEDLFRHVGQWNTGSTLGDNIDAAMRHGIRLREECPREWPVRTSKVGDAQARMNRILEAIDLSGVFDAVVTVLHDHHPVLIGLDWPGGGRRPSGHAVCATRFRNGKIRGPNSWHRDWGDSGFFELTERECGSFSHYGAFAVLSVTERGDDPQPPHPLTPSS